MCMLQAARRSHRNGLILHNIFTHLQNVIMLIPVSIVFMIASCFFASCTALVFYFVFGGERRRFSKFNSMLPELVHTLKCLVLCFHFFISFPSGYQRVMINAPIFLESSLYDHQKPFRVIISCNLVIIIEIRDIASYERWLNLGQTLLKMEGSWN